MIAGSVSAFLNLFNLVVCCLGSGRNTRIGKGMHLWTSSVFKKGVLNTGMFKILSIPFWTLLEASDFTCPQTVVFGHRALSWSIVICDSAEL